MECKVSDLKKGSGSSTTGSSSQRCHTSVKVFSESHTMPWGTSAQTNLILHSKTVSIGQTCDITLNQCMYLPALTANRTNTAWYAHMGHYTPFLSLTTRATPSH